MSKYFDIVVATTKKYGIGLNNTLPWNSRLEMNLFRKITTSGNSNNIVIMGRKTYDSIPRQFKPLKNRINMVLSNKFFDDKKHDYVWFNRNLAYFKSFDTVMDYINKHGVEENLDGNIYVIGGGNLYNQTLMHPNLRYIFRSEIQNDIDCDTFINFDDENYRKIYESELVKDTDVSFNLNIHQNQNYGGKMEIPKEIYKYFNVKPVSDYFKTNEINKINKNEGEQQYLNLLDDIMINGVEKPDRTGTGIVSVFGRQLRFNNIEQHFPLLTTKRVFWKGVSKELMWFLSGSTDATLLQKEGVHIWDGNTSREFLDKNGLEYYDEGDCGPFYGFQWRHFGADYEDKYANYEGKGYDQVKWCIDEIKKNPTSRRLIVSAWNASVLKEMCLNPCHVMYQFYANPETKELSVHMYQRSADVFLGLPFNIASTALFLKLMCKMTDYQPKDVVVSLGDAHIYSNHVEQCKTQMERKPYDFPQLEIADKQVDDISEYTTEDFKIMNYKCHPTIKAKMAI